MKATRHFTLIDRFCLQFDQALRSITGTNPTTGRANPAVNLAEDSLTATERRQSAALMRINHAGEICAQALYHGQTLSSRSKALQAQLQQAALEEGDHLTWCRERLTELHSHTSYLNPFWYVGSFCIGLAAGLAGDQWSLGFVAETERQVVKHLDKHLHTLAPQDQRSHSILAQMKIDEAIHRHDALEAGAHTLPRPIQIAMTFTSKVMVTTASRI